MRILFSAIGLSDPVCTGHDGPWIHCCRFSRPDLTVVYLTAAMCQREHQKKMYSCTLDLLNKALRTQIRHEFIKRPNLDNPQDSDQYYKDFEEILTQLHETYPDAEILLNASSGTPAIKECMKMMYHFLPFETKLLKVDSPIDEMGFSHGRRDQVPDDYDPEEEWDNNKDNLEGAAVRCHVDEAQQQSVRLQMMQLRKLIENNEFQAACLLTETDPLKGFVSERLRKGLSGAKSRMQLDLQTAAKDLLAAGWDGAEAIRKMQTDLLSQAAEMLMTMQCDLDRGDIAGCVRKLTPVLYVLLRTLLESKYGISIKSIAKKNAQNFWVLSDINMMNNHKSLYDSVKSQIFTGGKPPYLDSNAIIKLLNGLTDNYDTAFQNMKLLRQIEQGVRNRIAHEPKMLTEDQFKTDAGISTKEMMKLLIDCFGMLRPAAFSDSFWNSYADMRKYLSQLTQLGTGQ